MTNIGRNEAAYFRACHTVWARLVACRMRNRAAWRLLGIIHRMGVDFALSEEQAAYVAARIANI